jgi:hypothetical protein
MVKRTLRGTHREGTRQEGLAAIHGALFDILSILDQLKLPEDTIEGELARDLRPVFERYDSRLKAAFSIPPKGELLNVMFKTFCSEHERPYRERNANMPLAAGYLLQAFMETLKFPEDKPDKHEIATLFRSVAEDATPICCRLTEDKRLELLSRIEPSTGDEELDKQAAERAGIMERVKDQGPLQ